MVEEGAVAAVAEEDLRKDLTTSLTPRLRDLCLAAVSEGTRGGGVSRFTISYRRFQG